MKKCAILTIIGAGLLTACSSDPIEPVKSTQEVTYFCGVKHDKALKATYQFMDNEAVSATVHFDGKVYENLERDINNMDSNLFKGANNIVWVADKFDLNNVKTQHGIQLYKDGKKADTIIAKYCDLR